MKQWFHELYEQHPVLGQVLLILSIMMAVSWIAGLSVEVLQEIAEQRAWRKEREKRARKQEREDRLRAMREAYKAMLESGCVLDEEGMPRKEMTPVPKS